MSNVVISAHQPTLPWSYGGSSFTVRYFYSQGFLDDLGRWTPGGDGQTGFYIEVAGTIDGSGILHIPDSTIISPLGGRQPNTLCSAQLFDENGTGRDFLFTDWTIPQTTPTTFGALEIVNEGATLVNILGYILTTAQILQVQALINIAVGLLNKASAVIYGLVRLSVSPAFASAPIAVGDNDPRVAPTGAVYWASHYDSFDDAVLAMGSSVPVTLIVSEPMTTTNPTIPPTVTLQFVGNGKLTLTTGMAVTIQGDLVAAPRSQIFANALSGQGTIVLQGDVYPDWWTRNATPGTTAMAGAINAADASVCSGVLNPLDGVTVAAQGRVRFTSHTYRVDSTLTYRGAPWIGDSVNNTVIVRYGSSGATVDAMGTSIARRELNISDVYFYGLNATSTAYGIKLGFNIRSYGALRRVKFSHFPSYGMHFVDETDDMSFYDVQVISCGGTSGFSGIKLDPSVPHSNDIRWYSLSLENNGKAGSGFGGGIDTTGAGVIHQWSFYGGLLQSNRGAGEVLFFGGSNINFYGTYIESEPTANVLTAMRFDTVLGVGIHDVFLTGSANTGSALKFTGGTTGVIDNIRAFDNWTTAITLEDAGTQIQVTSLGALVPGTSMVSIAAGTLLSWPAKNSNGVFIRTQAAPSTPTVATTLTAANLFIGIIIATPNATGATHAYTLPTGTNMESAAPFINNDSFDWSISNLAAAAADTVTITANTDHTIVGNPIVQSANAATGGVYGNSAIFRSRRVSGTIWTTYRLA